MKAVIWTAYGPPEVLQYQEIDRPVPGPNQVLVKVRAATVFAGDCEMRGFHFPFSFFIPLRLMFGVIKPWKRYQVPGQEFSGTVVEAGDSVSRFKVGDDVFCPPESLGAHAEYICLDLKARTVVTKPDNMTFEEAATVPVGGLNALHFVRKAEIKPGERVLINGAAGSIGTFAVQLAKLDGAEVTAVDSAAKLRMLQSIGADRVIDYQRDDFTLLGEKYDVIIDIVGKSNYSRSVASLNDEGRYILGNPRFAGLFRSFWTSKTSAKKVLAVMAGYRNVDLEYLRDLIDSGRLSTVIDRRFPLEKVIDAHRYVESGEKCGHVVLEVAAEKSSIN